MNDPSPERRRARAGFTLIEIMIVIAIIGMLMTMVGPYVYTKFAEAQRTTTKAKMHNVLRQAIEDYRRHYSRLPDSLEELLQPNERNLNNPYLDEDSLLDAWENPFVYTRISNSKYDIVSYGADNMEGGEAEDEDISLFADRMPGR